MEKNRIISWILAAIIMLSIMMIGKSCMGEPDTSGLKKNKKSKDETSVNINIQTGAVQTKPPEYDIFGKPVTTIATMAIVTTETTVTTVETDIFGQPVTTTVGTDAFGLPVTTDIPETTMQLSEDVLTETTTLSPLEQYQEDINNPNLISGFNHNKYDENGNPIPTLAPDFSIIIN